jgi:hypothetical protein
MAGVHYSESLQFLQFSPYIPLGLTNKSVALIIHWFSVASGSKGVQAEDLTQMLIKLAGTLIWSLEDF